MPIRLTAAEGIQPQSPRLSDQVQSLESQARGLQQTPIQEGSSSSDIPGNTPPSHDSPGRDGMHQVMIQYHRVLQRLVENQKRVMLDYFQSATGSAATSNLLTDEALQPSAIQPLTSNEDLQIQSDAQQHRITAEGPRPGQVPIAPSTDTGGQAGSDPVSPPVGAMPIDRKTLTAKL